MAGTQRRRINDGGPTARQAVQQRVLGNIGLRGLRMLGARPAGQGLAIAGGATGLGARGGVVVHRMVVRAAPQTVDHGAGVVWRSPEGDPTPQFGLSGYSPPSAAVPSQVRGVLTAFVQGLWESYRGGGDIVLVRTRGGAEATFTLEPGPITSRFWAGPVEAIDVRPGDTIALRPNHSGSPQDLTNAELQLQIIVTDAATSDVPLPAVCNVGWDGDYVVPVGSAAELSAVELSDGRVLMVYRSGQTIKQGYAADVNAFVGSNGSVTYDSDIATFDEGASACVSQAGGVLWLVTAGRTGTFGSSTAATVLFRSDDAGATWDVVQTLVSQSGTDGVGAVPACSEVFQTAAGTLLVAAPRWYLNSGYIMCRLGIWRSTDGGASWTMVHDAGIYAVGGNYVEGSSRSMTQGDDGTLVLARFGTVAGTGSNLITSTNDGALWTVGSNFDAITAYPYDSTLRKIGDGFFWTRPIVYNTGALKVYTSDDPTDFQGGGTEFASLAMTLTSGDGPLITKLGDQVVLFTKDRVYPGGVCQESG